MSANKIRPTKVRPFPWLCSNCCTATVVPAVIDYTTQVKHDGIVYDLHVPSLEIPRCRTCGETYSTTTVDDRVSAALRARLRLLTPEQIASGIRQLALKQLQFAEHLGVAPETISRWIHGALIQSRAMDNLLRVFFAFPDVRKALRGESQDPNLGTRAAKPKAAKGKTRKPVSSRR